MVAKTPEMRIALLTAVAVMALAACGGSSKPVSPGSGQASGSGTTGHPSSTSQTRATPPAPSVSTSTSSSSAVSLCRAPALSLSFLGGQGATGHGLLGFELRNVSSRTCHTFGFPGVQFVDAAGRPLPTVSTRTTQDFFGSAPERALDVAPGQSVSFRIGVTHGIPSSAGCTTTAAVSVIPPNDTESLHVTIPNGVYECRTATVTPVEQGTSAYP